MKLSIVLPLALLGAVASAQTIMEAGGERLTEQDIKLAESFVALLADEAPTEAEKNTLRAGLKKEFAADPATFRAGVGVVKQLLEEVRQFTDPTQVALGRMTLTTYFYDAVKDVPASDHGVILNVAFKKNPVLAFDKENMIALTKKDLDASLRFLWFSNGVVQPNAEQKRQMAQLGQVISQNYVQLSVEEKQFLAIGTITMALVDHQWKQMTADQRQQFLASYNQNYSQAMQSGQVQAKPIPNWSQNQNLDAGTYEFLSRMSMQNHLSMMNGINAMGGSDDYWTIRPVGW